MWRGQMPWLIVGSSRGSRSPRKAGAPSRSHHAQTIFMRTDPDATDLRGLTVPRPPMLPELTCQRDLCDGE